LCWKNQGFLKLNHFTRTNAGDGGPSLSPIHGQAYRPTSKIAHNNGGMYVDMLISRINKVDWFTKKTPYLLAV
jgi:hypothetical protein